MGCIVFIINFIINYKINFMSTENKNGNSFMYGSLFTLATILLSGLTIDNFSIWTLFGALLCAIAAAYHWIEFSETI